MSTVNLGYAGCRVCHVYTPRTILAQNGGACVPCAAEEWAEATALPRPKLPRVKELGDGFVLIDDEDDFGRPVTRVERREP